MKIRAMVVAAGAACGVLGQSGCIIWDTYDQVVYANESLVKANEGLDRANESLDTINEEVLGEIRRTNELLVELKGQLEVMQSIDTSLKNLDKHLASLRKTIENIDSTIPFLKLSEPEPEEEEAPPDVPAPLGGEAPGGEGGGR
ncbi:MAG: hypothetical protein ACF8R7_05315 [Phycisphaerales bacterium JB039]